MLHAENDWWNEKCFTLMIYLSWKPFVTWITWISFQQMIPCSEKMWGTMFMIIQTIHLAQRYKNHTFPLFHRIKFSPVWLHCGHKQANNPWSAWGKAKVGKEENQLPFVTTKKRNRAAVIFILATINPQHY